LPDQGGLGESGRGVRGRHHERVAFRLEAFLRLRRVRRKGIASIP